jgi:hypothetical protein
MRDNPAGAGLMLKLRTKVDSITSTGTAAKVLGLQGWCKQKNQVLILPAKLN